MIVPSNWKYIRLKWLFERFGMFAPSIFFNQP